jgi:hypothetical protein
VLLKSASVEAKARQSGFVKRKSKLTGSCFANLQVFSNGNLAETSLLEMCQEYEYSYGKPLSKQSLDERFNKCSVDFLKLLIQEVLSHHVSSDGFKDLLPDCKTIRIKDATSFQLSEDLQEVYPGSGGRTSKACLKTQFEYDLKSGKVLELSVGPYTTSDLTNSYQTIESINEQDLLIRDLGYIGLEFLERIIEKEAYFLNRIKSNVTVWTASKTNCFVPLDLAKIEKQMRKSHIKTKEFSVYLGNDKKVKCRLILECLPEDVKAEKLRKANRAAQKEGRELGKDTISRIGLNLFVTNLNEHDLPKEQVWSLYRLRWQIELVFKVWKSVASVDKIKKAKRERIECHLFGKLLWVMLGWNIFWKITNQIKDRSKAVSFNKMMKNLRKFCEYLKNRTLGKAKGVRLCIEVFVENVLRNCMLEKKKKNLSSIDIIIRLIAI